MSADRNEGANHPAVRVEDRAVWVAFRSPCEMHCVFCTRGVGGPLEKNRVFDRLDYVAELRKVPFVDGRSLCLGGDEPLSHPALLSLILAGRELGYRRIELRTSGQRLGEPEIARELARAGVTHVDLPLYGSTPEVHDDVTQLPGSHAGVWRSIELVRELGLELSLHSILLRKNLHDAVRLNAQARARLGRGVAFSVPHPRADADDYRQVAAPFPLVLRELGGSRLRLLGFPSCVALAVDPSNPGRVEPSASPGSAHEYPAGCEGCRLRSGCPGVLSVHRRAFGDDGLAPA